MMWYEIVILAFGVIALIYLFKEDRMLFFQLVCIATLYGVAILFVSCWAFGTCL